MLLKFSRKQKAFLGLTLSVIMLTAIVATTFHPSPKTLMTPDEINARQLAYYNEAVANQTASASPMTNASGSYLQGTFMVHGLSYAVALYSSYHKADTLPRHNLVPATDLYLKMAEGLMPKVSAKIGQWIPDCLVNCKNGIHYFQDPTTLITNQGRGIEQCLVYGTTVTDTCTASNFAKYIGWSVDTHTPANGDTYAGGATIPCSSTNLIVDANGLRDVAGTITAAANAATVTTTIAKTFSITGTYTAVQVSCMLSGTGTNADSGTNPLLYAESTFGPDSFANGDSLTGSWAISRS